jgi:cell division protein ZipA
MDGLRWLLLLCGALVIAGVYVYSRKERKRAPDKPSDIKGQRVAPTLGPEPDPDKVEFADESCIDEADSEIEAESSTDDEPVISAPRARQKIVTLRLVARDRSAFQGDELILSLRGIDMRHGKFGIFHRYDGTDEDKTVFSAASLVEPGSFDLKNIKDQQIPGISLFLVLPGPLDGAEAFDMMMESARALAQKVNGELLDESGSTLSIQRERYMREEIIKFQHSNLNA